MKEWFRLVNGEYVFAFPRDIVFEPQAALDTLLAIRSCDFEILGFFKITLQDEGMLSLGGLEIPKQEVLDGLGHELHDSLNLGFLQKLLEKGEDPAHYAVFHSHVRGEAYPSFTDFTTVKDQLILLLDVAMLSRSPEEEVFVGPYMELVFNVFGQTDARVHFLHKGKGIVGEGASVTKLEAQFPQAELALRQAINTFSHEDRTRRMEIVKRQLRETLIRTRDHRYGYSNPPKRRGQEWLEPL